MKINNIYIYLSSKYENHEQKEFYKVTIRLESSKETDIEISLNEEEQKPLFNALKDILPKKIDEFNAEFKESL